MAFSVVVDPEPSDANQGATFSASVNDGRPFVIGKGVRYQQRRGLMSTSGGLLYNPKAYPQLGAWADLLDCTAYCESKRVTTCLNTYDRAAFTIGCLQFAAHVANGDFVQWFRTLLGRSDAADVFPDLRLSGGRICQVADGAARPLESDSSTSALMAYLNADGAKVDKAETLAAARLIHWITTQGGVRDTHVEQGLKVFRSLAASHASTYSLDGRPDFIVAAIIDIYHQGRGGNADAKRQAILGALRAATVDAQLDGLLSIGADAYPDRCTDLGDVIRSKRASGELGRSKYDAASGDFVPSAPGPHPTLLAPLGHADALPEAAPGLPAILTHLQQREACEAFVGMATPDANRPGNMLLVTSQTEIFSFAGADIVESQPVDSQSVRLWVRKGARGWRSVPFEIGGAVRMRETRVGMEDLAPPEMEAFDGMPAPATRQYADALREAPAAGTLAAAASAYNGTCSGGDRYQNNCAHFLSDAFIRAGFSELLPGGSAGQYVTARCDTSARRVIRARDMWHWFQSKATQTADQLTRNTGLWAVFQLRESAYWGGHVIIFDTDTWTYHGTGCYLDWDQHAYKW